jgi:hypothetical protein
MGTIKLKSIELITEDRRGGKNPLMLTIKV